MGGLNYTVSFWVTVKFMGYVHRPTKGQKTDNCNELHLRLHPQMAQIECKTNMPTEHQSLYISRKDQVPHRQR